MPLIAVNLSDKLLQEIRELVERERYASLESFIEIGAFNQLALERGATPAEIIERGHRRPPTDGPPPEDGPPPRPPAPPPAPQAARSSAKAVKIAKSLLGKKVVIRKLTIGKAVKPSIAEPTTKEEVSAVFGRLNRATGKTTPRVLSMPPQAQPGDRVFGQVNRLFPAKFICRWLANAAVADGQWPRFTTICARMADDAATLGSFLDEWDQQQERERGGELATALPRRKNNASLDRFLSQFVARITRASDIAPGAVCQYELARFDDDATLALTEQGLAFAALENPVLDARDKIAPTALSADEAEFLVNHIRLWVPTEWADMRTALKAVQAGQATPTEVAAAVKAELPDTWTESMFQTHVSGVIARLSDIRLLHRRWQGRNVQYQPGDDKLVETFMGANAQERP
jgi:hypothetical protein